MNAILEKLNDMADALVKLDNRVGLKRIVIYLVLILLIIGLINFKAIVKGTVELVSELSEEIHVEKMEKRDELLKELSPILQEFRSTVGSDRILYFEYHNTKENLVGIPFKYVDIVLQNSKYGVALAPESGFKEINVGTITALYEDIKTGDIVYCAGEDDEMFNMNYPGAVDIFRTGDGSKQQVFLSIPGIHQPVGMIVLEWMGNDDTVDVDFIKNVALGSNSFISRINGLIMSKR